MELLSHSDMLLRLLAAMAFGMVLGLERIMAHKSAGMRTYALVSMGSALFVIVSQMVLEQNIFESFDPLRIAAQIVSGVGFLGTGLIVFQENRLVGMTTASGIWVAAGIGIAAGFGLYDVALYATILSLIVFTILWFVEHAIKHFRDKFFKSYEQD